MIHIKKNGNELAELSIWELEEIDGGRNFLEYTAKAIGYVSGFMSGLFDLFEERQVSTAGVTRYGEW